MPSKHQISCITKTNRFDPHDRIDAVGGVNGNGTPWRLPQPEAVAGVDSGKYAFFVRVNNREVDVIVAVSRNGNRYLKTVADGDQPNNLLSLPECP